VTLDTRADIPRRRLSAGERRETILGAALDVFARHGYQGASIDEIAQAAGISKALIYEHFPSKKELHISLLETHVGELFARMVATTTMGDTPEARLRSGVGAVFAFVAEHREAWRLLFRDAVEPDVAERLQAVQGQATALIAQMMAADPDVPAGLDAEREVAVEMYAQQLSGAVQALANWWLDHPDVARETLVDRVVDFTFTGMERVREAQLAPRGSAELG